MANLTIDIVTKYDQSLQGAQKITDSYKKMGKQLIEASNEGKVADEVQRKYIASLNAALLGLENETNALAASKAQIKLLTQERGKMTTALGANAELVKKLSDAIEEETEDMKKLETESRKVSRGGMAELEKSSGNAATKLLSVAKNILKFQLLMGPITGAIRGFKNTLSDSVKVAAEAEQIYNKLSTVFVGLEDSAKAAAKAISSDLGVATTTAASALSTVGDLLQAQGMGTSQSLATATSWVSQFQDIIAFKDLNMTLEEFAQNFMSGAAGNLRNFRTFGSIVKESAVNARLAAQGLDKLTGSQLELAKMTTRANMALEQQKNAMGATEREWDSMLSINRRLTEAWKEYKENLGETINTVLKPMKTWVTDILEATNRTGRILKEIKGGEFTIKVEQALSSDFSDEILSTLLSVSSGLNYNSTIAKISEAVALAGGATMEQLYPVNQFSATQLRNVMLGTGATRSQVESVATKAGFSIPKEVYDEAERLANTYKEQKKAADAVTASLLSMGENTDSFTEALASLAHMNFTSSSLGQAVTKENIDFFNMDEISGRYEQLSAGAVKRAIRLATGQIGNLTPEDFMDGIDIAFNIGDKEKAYQSWLEEIRSLYTLLYNHEVEFGDVGQETLDSVIALWAQVNGEAHEYLANIERINKATSDYNALGANYSNMAAGYRTDMANIGLSSDQITRNGLLAAFEEANAKRSPAARVIKEALDAFDDLLKAQDKYNKKLELEASIKARRDARAATEIPTEYQTQLAQFGMSDRDLLMQQRNELASKHDPLWVAIQREIDAFDELEKKTRELAIAETWAATGERALGATGTLGSVVGQFTDGEGDTWSDIVNALLTIMENTEGWSDIAATLDQIFEMFEPVVDAIINLIVALPWDGIIKALKIVASAIVIITGIVRGIVEVIKWLWNNISAALHNIWEAITHPLGGGSYASFESFDDLMNTIHKVAADTQKELGDIKDVNENIERNTRDDDVLKTLRELYETHVIDEDQFYKGARVIQKDMVFDPVPAGSPKYVSGRAQTSAVINYGGLTINVQGTDPEATARAVVRKLQEVSDISVNIPIEMGAY